MKTLYRRLSLIIFVLVAVFAFSLPVAAQSTLISTNTNLGVFVGDGFNTTPFSNNLCDAFSRSSDSSVVILCRQPNLAVASNPSAAYAGVKQGFFSDGTYSEIATDQAIDNSTTVNGSNGEVGVFFFIDSRGNNEAAVLFVGQDGNDGITYTFVTPVTNGSDEAFAGLKTLGHPNQGV